MQYWNIKIKLKNGKKKKGGGGGNLGKPLKIQEIPLEKKNPGNQKTKYRW